MGPKFRIRIQIKGVGECGCVVVRRNDIITVVSQQDEHCWVGELNGLVGWFPAKFVQVGLTKIFAKFVQVGFVEHFCHVCTVGLTNIFATFVQVGQNNRIKTLGPGGL